MGLIDCIILVLSCAADIYLSHNFFFGYFPKKLKMENRLTNAIVFIFFVILQFSANLLGRATLNLLIIPIVLFIYLAIVFDAQIVQKIMYFIIILSVLLGCDFLFTVIAETTNEDSGLYLASMPWQIFTIKLMSFTIMTIIKRITDNTQNKFTNKIFWLYLCVPFASLGMMFTSYYIQVETIDEIDTKLLLTVLFAFMLLSNVIVFTAFNRYEKAMLQTMQQEWIITKEKLNRRYYEKINVMNENRQTLIHDFKHYISGLRAVANDKGPEEVLAYLDELDSRVVANEIKLYSNIPFLDSVLSEKKEYALKKGVSLKIQVEPDCSLNDIKQMDYVVMLGNLLDNAIQASERAKLDFCVFCNIFMENKGAFLITKIQNRFNPKFLNIKEGNFISSKTDGGIHGIGIKSVKSMANECGGILTIDIQGDLFTAILVLPGV